MLCSVVSVLVFGESNEFLEEGEEGIYWVKSASGQLGKFLFNLLSPSSRSACVYHEYYSVLIFLKKKSLEKKKKEDSGDRNLRLRFRNLPHVPLREMVGSGLLGYLFPFLKG